MGNKKIAQRARNTSPRALPQERKITPLTAGKIRIHPLWFDSMGAKSSSFLLETPDLTILVDPGASEMQPSFPLPEKEKIRIRDRARSIISAAAKKADTVFISHYHYDHHTPPSLLPDLYRGKKVWIKDPNRWINSSQRERARVFIRELNTALGREDRENWFTPPGKVLFRNPMDSLPLAAGRDYGDYQRRKDSLIRRGVGQTRSLAKKWSTDSWIAPFETGGTEVCFVDGKEFQIGQTRIRFSPPLFHGVEFARVGWVIALVVEYANRQVLYTSDLQGPMIEDYAEWIIRQAPEIVLLDGPPTYLFGYIMNRINLERAVANACRIIEELKPRILIYDHHLARDPHFAERTARVYETAREQGIAVDTAAELGGRRPLVLELSSQTG